MSTGSPRQILIVGAGLAGIGAALELSRNWPNQPGAGPTVHFDIFEANNYIGGRVRSCSASPPHDSSHPTMVELGAAWFHSILTNVLLAELTCQPDALFTQQQLDSFLHAQRSGNNSEGQSTGEDDLEDESKIGEGDDFFESAAKLLYYFVDDHRPAEQGEIRVLNQQRSCFNRLLNGSVSDSVADSFNDCYELEWNYQIDRFKNSPNLKLHQNWNLDDVIRCLKSEASFHEGTDQFQSLGIKTEKYWDAKGTDFTLPELIGAIQKDVNAEQLDHLNFSKNLIEKLYKSFEKNIFIQRRVESIELDQETSDSSRVLVTFSDQSDTSGSQQQYYDYVIFTGSLKCLQNSLNASTEIGKPIVFNPPLDEQKSNILLNYCQMGSVEKVFFRLKNTDLSSHFPTAGSDLKPGDYRVIWLISKQPFNQLTGVHSCFKNVYFLLALNAELSDLMIVLTNKEDCREMLMLSESQLVSGLEAFLITVFGLEKCNVALLARSEWCRVASIGGSYSSFKPGCPSDASEILAAPVCDSQGVPRVLFAGEHTHSTWTSSMHGAFDSGRREVRRLAGHL